MKTERAKKNNSVDKLGQECSMQKEEAVQTFRWELAGLFSF